MIELTKLKKDIYGNIRYYIDYLQASKIFEVPAAVVGIHYRKLGLSLYRGKKYGTGYVLQSYNVDESLQEMKQKLDKILLKK